MAGFALTVAGVGLVWSWPAACLVAGILLLLAGGVASNR